MAAAIGPGIEGRKQNLVALAVEAELDAAQAGEGDELSRPGDDAGQIVVAKDFDGGTAIQIGEPAARDALVVEDRNRSALARMPHDDQRRPQIQGRNLLRAGSVATRFHEYGKAHDARGIERRFRGIADFAGGQADAGLESVQYELNRGLRDASRSEFVRGDNEIGLSANSCGRDS